MLVIRQEQMDAFSEAARTAFENEMVVHSKAFTPRLSEVLGEEQLRMALREGISRASEYEFTNRGPIRLFLELRFLFGSHFDTDPQYPWAAQILKSGEDQMHRAERLYEKTLDYQKNVSGPQAANTRRALRELPTLAQQPLPFSARDLVPGILREMTRVFPEKVAYIGEEGLRALIHEGSAEARKHGFPAVRGDTLLVVLMFAFGHGCTNDPLYPWISRTLNNEKFISPAACAERLEKKALTWVTQVLARHPEGAQS